MVNGNEDEEDEEEDDDTVPKETDDTCGVLTLTWYVPGTPDMS